MREKELKELLFGMLERRVVVFSDFEVDTELCKELVGLGVAEQVSDFGDYEDYVLVPSDEVDINALKKVYDAMLELRYGDEEVSAVLALMMYRDAAGGLEFIDPEKGGQVAWLFDKVFQRLGIEPDEVVDLYDYRRTYRGSVYARYGSVWIRKYWDYCNSNRYGTVHGVFKGVYYSIEEPPKAEVVRGE